MIASSTLPPSCFELGTAPYSLSGNVYGVLLNRANELASLGDAVHHAPYKAPPKAPVLYLKPRNTLSSNGSVCAIPTSETKLSVGASIGIVIGQLACKVTPEQAQACIAGYIAVCDISVPHDAYYRPSVRQKALDGSCVLGLGATGLADPESASIRTYFDGTLVDEATPNYVRSAVQLIVDISAFMSLHPGDVVLLGTSIHAPTAQRGQQVRIEIQGFAALELSLASQKNTQGEAA